MKIKWIYGAVIAGLIVLSGFMYTTSTEKSVVSIDVGTNVERQGATKEAQVPMIVIYVTGEVLHPDVYTVPEHSRLYEVIEGAGGFTSEASKEALNLARFVFDGERIYVPNNEASLSGDQLNGFASSKVSINLGNESELMTLTGIGASKAQAIIEYREANGPFQKIEDIMNVNGIKDAMFDKIKDDIVI